MISCFDETGPSLFRLSCNNSHNTSLSGTVLNWLFMLWKPLTNVLFVKRTFPLYCRHSPETVELLSTLGLLYMQVHEFLYYISVYLSSSSTTVIQLYMIFTDSSEKFSESVDKVSVISQLLSVIFETYRCINFNRLLCAHQPISSITACIEFKKFSSSL